MVRWMRTTRASAAVAVGILVACSGGMQVGAAMTLAGFGEVPFVSGLTQPTGSAFLPDGRLLVTEKGGRLVLASGGTTSTLLVFDVCTGSEMGLLDVAVDPGFGAGGFVYLYRTKPGGSGSGCGGGGGRTNQVVRVTMAGDGSVDSASLVELVAGLRADGGNHDGGGLRMGPDGLLYVGVGDTGIGDNQGGPGSSTNPYAQDLGTREGKILRVALDGGIPPDNPFAGQPGRRGEIFAYGFRNPWRFGFDPTTGRLWAGDVGDETIEEIDVVVGGGNYGWPRCEGASPGGCAQPGDVAPIFTYPHDGADSLGESITGGAFAGTCFGALAGEYVFADFVADAVYHVPLTPGRDGLAGAPAPLVSGADGPVDLVFGPDGALYYTAFGAGEVRRVAADAAPCATTTTLVPRGCPVAPTSPSIRCRVEALMAAIGRAASEAALRNRLLVHVQRAGGWNDLAERQAATGQTRRARATLRNASRQLVAFDHALASDLARRELPRAIRKTLRAQARDLLADLRLLRRPETESRVGFRCRVVGGSRAPGSRR
jgi:glucose/arabinose dehydrogenase